MASLYLNVHGDGGNSGKVLFGARSKSTDSFQSLDSAQALSANTWYFVTATIDYTNATMKLYVNGVLSATGTGTFGSSTYQHSGTPTEPDSISSTNYVATYPFQGDIGHTSVYSRVLTSSEIVQNCNALSGRYAGVTCP